MVESDPQLLLRRIRQGDGAAFAQFYDAYFDACLGYARSCTKRDADFCFDVVQELMLRIADKPPQLQRAESLDVWLRKSVFNHAVDRLRAEGRRRKREGQAAERASDRVSREPVHDAIEAEERSWLETQLATLPALERELLEARFLDRRTLADSGAHVGLGVDAAHGRIRRTLLRLRSYAVSRFTRDSLGGL